MPGNLDVNDYRGFLASGLSVRIAEISQADVSTLRAEGFDLSGDGLIRPKKTGALSGVPRAAGYKVEDSPLVRAATRLAEEAKLRSGYQSQAAGSDLASNPLVANAIKRAEQAEKEKR